MKKLFVFVFFSSLAISPSTEAEPFKPDLGYFEGSYILIGIFPDSDQTFSGRAKVSLSGRELKITRVINGRTIEAIGTMGKGPHEHDEMPRLLVTFEDGGKQFKDYCYFSNDGDNYARLTCYLYHESTKKVGLEAWFYDPWRELPE